MKSFLLKDNKPIIKWGNLADETYFEGRVPEGYNLAVAPSKNIVVLDVDYKGEKNGYLFIPPEIKEELDNSFHYFTKSGGSHYWLDYTGGKKLMNRATKIGLDLRVGASGKNSGGYVKYHHNKDIRECRELIKKTSLTLNKWLEELYT